MRPCAVLGDWGIGDWDLGSGHLVVHELELSLQLPHLVLRLRRPRARLTRRPLCGRFVDCGVYRVCRRIVVDLIGTELVKLLAVIRKHHQATHRE